MISSHAPPCQLPWQFLLPIQPTNEHVWRTFRDPVWPLRYKVKGRTCKMGDDVHHCMIVRRLKVSHAIFIRFLVHVYSTCSVRIPCEVHLSRHLPLYWSHSRVLPTERGSLITSAKTIPDHWFHQRYNPDRHHSLVVTADFIENSDSLSSWTWILASWRVRYKTMLICKRCVGWF